VLCCRTPSNSCWRRLYQMTRPPGTVIRRKVSWLNGAGKVTSTDEEGWTRCHRNGLAVVRKWSYTPAGMNPKSTNVERHVVCAGRTKVHVSADSSAGMRRSGRGLYERPLGVPARMRQDGTALARPWTPINAETGPNKRHLHVSNKNLECRSAFPASVKCGCPAALLPDRQCAGFYARPESFKNGPNFSSGWIGLHNSVPRPPGACSRQYYKAACRAAYRADPVHRHLDETCRFTHLREAPAQAVPPTSRRLAST